jgi:DNA-binding LytR/AlgR family response regulator
MRVEDTRSGQRFFFIRKGKRYHRIDYSRIRFLEAWKKCCRINTVDKVWLVAIGISQLEEVLPAEEFCRIHRSYLVGLAHIDWFEKSLLRVADRDLPVSDAYRPQLERKVILVPLESPRPAEQLSKKAMVLEEIG